MVGEVQKLYSLTNSDLLMNKGDRTRITLNCCCCCNQNFFCILTLTIRHFNASQFSERSEMLLNGKTQDYYFDRMTTDPLTLEQHKLLIENTSKNLEVVLRTLRRLGISFVVAGSFAAFIAGRLNCFKDIDIFVNVDDVTKLQVDDWPEFKESEQYEDPQITIATENKKWTKWGTAQRQNDFLIFLTVEEQMLMYRFARNVDEESRVHRLRELHETRFRLKIANIIKIEAQIEKLIPIDIVLAPNNECCTCRDYCLYILKSFDIQVARVGLFNTNFQRPFSFEFLTLTTPDNRAISRKRRAKYAERVFNVIPSRLTTLALNTMLDAKILSYKWNTESQAVPPAT